MKYVCYDFFAEGIIKSQILVTEFSGEYYSFSVKRV